MANRFPSATGAAARGFTSTFLPRKLQSQQVEAQQQAVAQTAAGDRIEETQTLAFDMLDRINSAAVQSVETGLASPEDIEQFRLAHDATLADFITTLETNKALAVQAGAPPELIQAIEDRQRTTIAQRTRLFQSNVDAAQFMAEANRAQGSTQFTAQVGEEQARVTSKRNADGTFSFFIGDQPVDPSTISVPVQSTRQVGGPLQIPGLTETQSGVVLSELRSQAAAAETFTQISNQLLNELGTEAPEKVGVVASVLRGLSSLTEQAQAFANVTGVSNIFEGKLEDLDETYNFQDLAGESQEVKTRLLDLVFMNLAAKGQTGRAVSDRDLQIFMNATGFGTGDPGLVSKGLEAAIEDNQIALNNNILIRGGGSLALEDILPRGLTGFQALGSGGPTQDQLRAIEAAIDAGNLDEATRLMDGFEGR